MKLDLLVECILYYLILSYLILYIIYVLNKQPILISVYLN